jgi:predicted nucleic acid-binding Zn ribbon protein
MRFWKRKKQCKECGANISIKDEYCDKCRERIQKEFEKKVAKKIRTNMYGIEYHSREDELRHDRSKDVDLKDLFLKLDEIRPMLYRLSNKLEDFKGRIGKGSRLDLVRDLVRDTAHDLSKIYDIVVYLLTLE